MTIYGELEALIDKETVSTVEAVTECRVLKLGNAQFLKWLRTDNAFTLYITTLIAQRNYDCSKRERVNAFYPLKYRIMYMIYNTLCKKTSRLPRIFWLRERAPIYAASTGL